MDQQWRLADGMILTHLDNGGWTIADLHYLAIHELDEESGDLINHALSHPIPTPLPPIVSAATESGILIHAPQGGDTKETSS